MTDDAVPTSEAGPASTGQAREIDRLCYDVVVVGAGGSGLRAAIEARLQGKKTAIISKSLFGKAHTVMAEGGCAASMGNGNREEQRAAPLPSPVGGRKFPKQRGGAGAARKGAPGRGGGAGGGG